MERRIATMAAVVMMYGLSSGLAMAQQNNQYTAGAPLEAVAQVEMVPQVEVVSPESLGIYRSSSQRDPLSRGYRSGTPVTVFDTDFIVSVQPPDVAARDFEGNEQVRLPR